MSRPFRTNMPDEEIETLATMFEVPFIKAKGIIFFSEWREAQNPVTVNEPIVTNISNMIVGKKDA